MAKEVAKCESTWLDEVDIELKMSGKCYMLLTELVVGRNRADFNEADNKLLDTWALKCSEADK